MKLLQLLVLPFLFCLLSVTAPSAEELKLTNIKVIAYEYYDYYAMPDAEKWRKVKSIKIEGQNRAGSTQAYQSGPGSQLEATLWDVSVPSQYWITVRWDDGTKTYQSHTSTPQKETVHHIYAPY